MEPLMQENRVFNPPADFVKSAAIPGMEAYNKLCAEAEKDYDGFWGRLAKENKVVAIGETGLDYFRVQGDLAWQRDRFRTHIKAAIQSNLPLIIHTRNAAEDTLKIMREEGADKVGGVMHCFTESLDVALDAIKLNFYISFSGIVTFKNAIELKEVVKSIPLDRILIETDSPYLAPVPYRGKINDPSNVIHVAEEIAKLKNISLEEVGAATTHNFFKLFSKCSPSN